MKIAMRHGAVATLLLAMLAGCASAPLKTEGVATDLTPDAAVSSAAAATGRTVLWGGVIVSATNLPHRTRLEIVGYPLDPYSQRPYTDKPPEHRFLAFQQGYLETAEYRAGRAVTVRGKVTGTEAGHVGDAAYTYPTVQVEALHLWPQRAANEGEPRFHFGIGILLGN